MYVLGIDVGTTGTKAILVDETGATKAKGYEGYALITPSEGLVEQDARLWWQAVVSAVRQACQGIDAASVAALSLSTQGGSSLLVDGSGEPLGNSLTWMDGRSRAEADELSSLLGEEAIYRKTGWPISPSLDAAKLLWYRRHEPGLLARASGFVSTLEFVNRKLVGRFVVDPTNAAIRQLLDLSTLAWDPAILDATGSDAKLLPEIAPSGAKLGTLTREAARELGLHEGVGVYNGAHDQYCACLGSGVTRPGELMLSTGTSWVLMAVTEAPLFTPSRICPGPHIETGRWGALAAVVAGVSLEWFRSKFLLEDYAKLSARSDPETAGPGEVFFFPWLSGAAFPHRLPAARASFIGLGFEHDRYDAAMAIMEGVAFQMREAIEEFARSGCAVSRVRVLGGALNSRFWTRAIANNIGCAVEATTEAESAAIGAAVLAAVGAGIFPDHRSAASAMNQARPIIGEDGEARQAYTEKFGRYRAAEKLVSSLYKGG